MEMAVEHDAVEASGNEQAEEHFTASTTTHAAQSTFRQLDRDFKDKKADLNELAKEVEANERRLEEGHRYYDSLCSEACYLEGVRDIKKKLTNDAEREKTEAENSVDHLRTDIENILKEIAKGKSIQNANLLEYETQVGIMSDLFLERRKSYEEVELEFTIKEINQMNATTQVELSELKNNFQQEKRQKENIENSYLQMEITLLKNCQKFVDENVKETKALYSENQKLLNRIGNIERYLKDLGVMK